MNYNDDILESDVGKFTNLHAHCRIASPLDGFSDIEDYVIRAKAMGMRGVLFSDHGLMSAAYELEKICKKHDMKPIYANELYFTPNDPLKKEKTEGFKPSYHLLLIAYNQEGYLNLMKLSSDAWTKYRYYKPRISWEQLEQHKNGIICLQACFTPGNAALTENGYSYIEDVSCDVFNGKGVISTATKTSRPYNGKVKDIKIKYGFPITCTDNHKFLYIAKNNLKKNIVSFDNNFEIGDYMLIPSSSLDYFVSSDITNNLAFILGAYAAEGYTTLIGNERCNAELDWTHFSLHKNETLFIQKIIENSKQIDPSSVSSLKYKPNSLSVTLSIKSGIIANACREYIGHYSDKKNIAKEILFGTKDIKSYFLSGYCYGDGYYRTTKAREALNIKETPEFTSASVSKLMTYSLSYMMTSLGIKNSISIVDAKIDKNNVCHKESYYLRCYGKSALFIKSLMDYVDTGNMQSVFENQFKKIELNGTGYFLNKIMDIDFFDYKGDVHCLNVPDTNMFVVSSVATSNCLGGFVAQMVLENKVEDAEDAIKRFKAIYGDNYYLEMQWTGIEEQNLVNSFFREMSTKLNVPLVVTCDSHYTWKHESELHRALVTINTGGIFKKKSEAKIGELTDDKDTDESSLFYTPGEYYLKPYSVMANYFNKPNDDVAFANTNKIAEMCNVVLPKNLKIFPQLIEDPESYIKSECLSFLAEYCKDMTEENKDVYLNRFEEEFWIISRMGYCDYFVVVADIMSFARQNNILTGPGRGCLVYETPVYLSDGSIKNLGDIVSGDSVVTHDGSICLVLNSQSYDINEELIHINTEFGDSCGITLTKDHKVYAQKHSLDSNGVYQSTSGIDWFAAKDLVVGDYIYTPWINNNNGYDLRMIDLSTYSNGLNSLNDEDKCYFKITNPLTKTVKTLYSYSRYIEFDNDLAYLLGLFTGDGWLVSNKKHIFCLCFNSETNASSLNRIRSYLNKNNISYSEFLHNSKKLIQIEIRWPHMAFFIRSIFNRYKLKSNTKHIPDIIINHSDKSIISNYLKGAMDSDGSFLGNRFKYSTTSKELAYGMKYLFNLIKIPSSILHLKRKPDSRGYNNQLDNYGLSIPAIFVDNQFITASRSRAKILHDGYLSRITNISYVNDVHKVYDIEVETNHNYLTSSGIVHNSAAGCLISFCLQITWIDPIKYNLLFSRFLSSSRAKMPLIEFDEYPIVENL